MGDEILVGDCLASGKSGLTEAEDLGADGGEIPVHRVDSDAQEGLIFGDGEDGGIPCEAGDSAPGRADAPD